MGKDPAFLFYTSDFLTGTMFMNFEQRGKYIYLLCAQHQHEGIIDKNSFNTIVGDDKILRGKFIENENGFFNLRLSKEILNRKKGTDASRENGKLGGRPSKKPKRNLQVLKTKPKHNLSEDEDENENTNENNNEVKIELVLPFDSQKFLTVWNVLKNEPKWRNKTIAALQASLKKLGEHSEQDAIKMMENSIAGGWQGLFELEKQKNKNGNRELTSEEKLADYIRTSKLAR